MRRGAFLVLVCCCLAGRCDDTKHGVGRDDLETDCTDGLDNNDNGYIDCADPACADIDEACLPGEGGSDAGGSGGAPVELEAGAGGTPLTETGGAPSITGGAGESSGGATTEVGGEGPGPGPTGAGSCDAPVTGVIGDYELLPPFADSVDFTSGSCQAATTGVDVAFEVTGTANGILQATAYSTDSDVDVSVRSSCADAQTELDCSSYNKSGMADTVTTPITVGQKVIVIVSRANAAAQAPAYLQLLINN